MSMLVAAALLLASWVAQTFDEQVVYVAQFKAEAHAIAVENCGKPYFGMWCQ